MDYKKNIIGMINMVDDMGTLEYLNTFIRLFLNEWGGVGYWEKTRKGRRHGLQAENN